MSRQFHTYILFFLIAFMITQAAYAAPEQVKQDLVAHKALYDIKLLSKRSGSQILNVDGQMFYEWQKGCDAWETKHRFNLLYEYSDSPSMRITSDFSTFETFDGQTLNFASRRMRDGDLFEEIRGHAEIAPQGKGIAKYTLPDQIDYILPKGSVFPMGHTMNVLQQIKAGQKIYSATIFDGSDERGPRQANAIIGKAVAPLQSVLGNKNIDKDMLKSPAHKLRLAYFILSENDPNAEHEMDVIFHENGMISSMVIDYEDFSISQKLIALEPLASSCHRTPKKIREIK